MRDRRTLTCCVILLFILAVGGKEEHTTISSSGERIRVSEGFGSGRNGEVSVSISVEVDDLPAYPYKCPPHLSQCENTNHTLQVDDLWFQFVIFNDRQRLDALYYTGSDGYDFDPWGQREEFRGSLAREIILEEEDYYHVYVFNSRKADITIQGHFTWKQRDGGLLSYEDIPTQWTSALGLIVSGLTTIVWACVLVKGWNFATLFHVVLLFICLFQVTHFLLEFVDVAAEAHGMPIPALSSTQIPLLLRVIAETLLMGIILLVSVGWGILAYSLSLRSKQLFTAAILLYGGFDFLCSLCLYPQVLCTVYELFFNVVKFLIYFSALIALNSAAELLRSEFYLQHPQRKKMVLQIMLFCNLRYLLVPLMAVPVTIIFLEFTVLSWQESWISPFINNCLFLFSVWWLGYELRPQQVEEDRVYLLRRPARNSAAEQVEEVNQDEELLQPESDEDDLIIEEEEEEEEPFDLGEDVEMQVFASDGVL